MSDAHKSQEDRILWTLEAAWPNWVPAPALAKISLQYNARIFSLRRRRGWLIENRVRIVNGMKHGEFRLGPRPIPSSAELRKTLVESSTRVEKGRQENKPRCTNAAGDLLFDLTPETARHRDDG